MNKWIFRTLLCAIVVIATPIHAAERRGAMLSDPNVTIDFVLNAGYTAGGDDLIETEFTDGDDETIKAGDGMLFGAGLLIKISESAVMQFTANYHLDSISVKNGDASFERYPIEMLLFFNNDKHRVGGGLTAHLSPTAEIDIDGMAKDTFNFNTSFGLILEYDYQLLPSFWLGLRYLHIDYKTESAVSETSVSGNHLGLMAHYAF